MATIDQLNFEVILDDKEFDAKVKHDIELAKQLNTSLSSLLNIKKQVGKFNQDDVLNNRKAQQIAVDTARAQEKINREHEKTIGLKNKLNAQVERINKGYLSQSRILNELKGYALGYLSIHGASQLLSSLVRVTGEFELQKTTLAAMLGDLNTAEGIITRIQGLAVESPFQFKELTTYAKQLSAFSVPAQELYDTTKMLADISAGLGVGMDRIVLAYGQVRSAAFLRGQEVRQFTEAGIPILDELAKQFSELEGRAVSAGEVFDKISARLVPFEMVAKVFKDMTSEGGKFYNMQEVQAETLKGKISNLKDAYEVMLNEIGKGQSENLKGAVDWARRLMTNYEETGMTLVELVTAYGVYKTMLGILTLATGTFSIANHKLLSALKGIGTLVANNPYALIAAGLAAIGYTIYKDITALESYEKIQKSIADTQSNFNKAVITETSKLDTLYAKLNLAKEGTEAYNAAKKEIYTKYASYISELQNEGIAVDNLATIYENLKIKIENSQKARFRSIASQDLEQVYGTEISNILSEAEKATNRLLKKTAFKFNEMEKQAIQAYVGGIITKDELSNDERLKKIATILNEAARSGNYEWQQFGTSIETARNQFEASTKAYKDGLDAIDAVYGKVATPEGSIIPPLVPQKESDEAVKVLEKEIAALKTLKKEYDEWKALGVSDDAIVTNLQGYFPNIKSKYGEDFITQLNFATRILEKIKELEKIAPDEAFSLMMSFGVDKAATDRQAVKDKIKAYEDIAKAAGKYYESIRKWSSEDFNLNGEGITLDISKIASDLNEKIVEIESRANKARELFADIDLNSEEEITKVKEIFVKEFGADAWDDFWNSYLTEGMDAIQQIADKQREYERKLAQEDVNDLAQKYVKEAYFTEGIDLTNLEDKTFLQLRDLKKQLQELAEKEPLKIPLEIENRLAEVGVDLSDLTNVNLDVIFDAFEDSGEPISETTQELLRLTQQIQKAELSVTDFGEVIKKVFKDGLSKLTEEERKALADTLSTAADTALGIMEDLAASMNEIAEISGDVELGEMAEQVSSMTGILSSAAQGAATGGWIGAIVGGATELINQITSVFTTMKVEEAELLANTRDFAYELSRLQYKLGDGFGEIFGGEDVAKALDAQTKMKKALADYNTLMDDLNSHTMPELYEKQEEFLSLGTTILLPGLFGVGGHFAGLRKTISNELKGAQEAYAKGYSQLEAMQVKTKDNSGFANFFGIKDEFTSLKDLAPQLWGPDGVFDVEAARIFLETNTQLNDQQRRQIQNIIDLKDAYDEAKGALDDYIESLYGQWSNDLADAISNAILTGSDAWAEFEKTASETIKNIGKDMMQYAFFDAVFDKFKDPLREAIGDPDAMIEQTTLLMEALASTVPQAQEWLEMFYDQAEKAGINIDGTESETLGDGIKGITEDTANLLASYLNAIRADVSFGKTQWSQMNVSLQQIVTLLTAQAAPSLSEYQAQIAANTYDTAVATQNILSRLESVITTEGGFDAIRTYS